MPLISTDLLRVVHRRAEKRVKRVELVPGLARLRAANIISKHVLQARGERPESRAGAVDSRRRPRRPRSAPPLCLLHASEPRLAKAGQGPKARARTRGPIGTKTALGSLPSMLRSESSRRFYLFFGASEVPHMTHDGVSLRRIDGPCGTQTSQTFDSRDGRCPSHSVRFLPRDSPRLTWGEVARPGQAVDQEDGGEDGDGGTQEDQGEHGAPRGMRRV